MATETKKAIMKTSILYITVKGFDLAGKLMVLLPEAEIFKYRKGLVSELWPQSQYFIFIMSAGIVVRAIAPLIKNKRVDPAVIVLDDHGRFAISLLSGHLGGGNRMVQKIADYIGGEAVITTASDVNNLPSLDLWARENNLVIEDWRLVPQHGTKLLDSGVLRVYTAVEIVLPPEFFKVADPELADVIVTNRETLQMNQTESPQAISPNENEAAAGDSKESGGASNRRPLWLRPKNLVIGLGCNSGTSAEEIEEAIKNAFRKYNLSFLAIKSLATIIQKSKEPGLISFGEKFGFAIKTFLPEELNETLEKVEGMSKSELVFKATGAMGVSEPAALLAAGVNTLLVPKQRLGNVTIAVAETP